MNDPISRQAALKMLNDDELERQVDDVLDGSLHRYKRAAQRIIAQLPTIDPVKHGKWIVIPQRCENQTFDECKCSVCGTVEYFNSGWKKFNYCPNCGATMETDE